MVRLFVLCMREEVLIKEFVSWLTHRLETDLLVARQGIQPREESALVVLVSLPELKPKFTLHAYLRILGGILCLFRGNACLTLSRRSSTTLAANAGCERGHE